jgi:hypothetical protein
MAHESEKNRTNFLKVLIKNFFFQKDKTLKY